LRSGLANIEAHYGPLATVLELCNETWMHTMLSEHPYSSSANWLCFFKLSSNFCRFLLIFTFFYSIFLNSKFSIPLTAYYIRNTNSLSIIRKITHKGGQISEKSPIHGVLITTTKDISLWDRKNAMQSDN